VDTILSGTSVSSVVIGAAAMLLALALLVQVVQEMWKQLLSTRAGVYTKVLEDFLGPVARQLSQPGVLTDLKSRGPFQFLRLRPQGKLLPLGQADLIEGLEQTTAAWLQRALRALRAEVAVQNGTPTRATEAWLRFMRELLDTAPEGPGDSDRTDLVQFFGELGVSAVGEPPEPFDAARALEGLRERFMPYALDAERHFGRLEELFDFQYRRRNLLLSFVFGLVAAFLLGYPIQAIVNRASAMSPEQTVALASSVLALSERVAAVESDSGRTAPASPARSDSALRVLHQTLDSLLSVLGRPSGPPGADGQSASPSWRYGLAQFARARQRNEEVVYLLGCVVTGLLISFGAPFWNDLLGALTGRARGTPTTANTVTGGARA
jgi:hypothetical protein